MLLFISFILILFTGIILLLSLFLSVECLTAIMTSQLFVKENHHSSLWQKTSIAVVIPAHNEELVIAESLNTIIPQLKEDDRLLVVADNCDDRTAEIAKEMGVLVIERKDTINRGKGYALDYGLQQLQANPPEVVIFIDADSLVEENALSILSERAKMTNKPIQALYLMEKPQESSFKDYISAFAFKLKNLVRPLGLSSLNLPCLLTGTGMAFPWQIINSVDNLASGEIVEDMKLGIDLTIAGYPPQFCPSVKITSILPQKQEAVITQRTRWEHGHLQNLLTYVPQLIIASWQKRKIELLFLGLDLAIPPLSLFIVISLATVLINGLFFIMTTETIPLLLSIISYTLTTISILLTWFKFAQKDLPLSILIKSPLYILWKLPVYFKFLTQKESQWIRTDRNNN
jgi:cellulose synthase/poly-beta-1,6-N-acetylglucosamine synthase-like glycosyltransferase